jgi:peroxiredoxin
MVTYASTRLGDLEQRFGELEAQLPDSPTKEALSVLHALLLESRRSNGPKAPADGSPTSDPSLVQVANLYKSAPPMEGTAENSGLPVGVPAPDFTLSDAAGQPVTLSKLRGKNVLLVFYPLDWSPACSDQLSLYQSELAEFQRLHTQVLAVSVDSLYSHGAWAAVRGIRFPLLADFNPRGEVARRYHVWREQDGFSERALFVIDAAGVIRYAHVSPELSKVPDIYDLFDQLRALVGKPAPPAVSGGR